MVSAVGTVVCQMWPQVCLVMHTHCPFGSCCAVQSLVVAMQLIVAKDAGNSTQANIVFQAAVRLKANSA